MRKIPTARLTNVAFLVLCGALGAQMSCSSDPVPSPATPSSGGAAGSGGGGGGSGAGLVHDDDSDRLGHCTFETPPTREALPAPTPGAVLAGLGSAIIEMPVGVPLGGYAGRMTVQGAEPVDDREGRWTGIMVPSAGLHDAPRAEAIALDIAGERVVIVQLDAPLLVEHALFAVERAIAPDGSMRGRVILTASHGHASWGGWQPNYALIAGHDTPRKELFERVVAAAQRASSQALSSLEPAKLGFSSVFDFDPTDSVSKDRRSQNDAVLGPDGNTAGQGKDPNVWAMRVDRADGTPLVALVNIPLHGTVGDEENPLASTGVAGAIERSLSAKLGYPVLHTQGAAGDIRPTGGRGRSACPDDARCYDMPRVEVLGARVAALTADLVRDVDTRATWAMEVVTRSFYIGKSSVVERLDGTVLSYAAFDENVLPDRKIFHEDGSIIESIDEFHVTAGAALCGEEDGSLSAIPETKGLSPYGSCLDIASGKSLLVAFCKLSADTALPFCETLRATASAVRFDDGGGKPTLLLTVPGEATAPFAAYLRGRSPAGEENTLLLGYAQDHLGYLLTAEDWLAGDFESSINVWGPLEGEAAMDGVLEAAAIAWTPELEDPEVGSSRHLDFEFPPNETVVAVATTDHGTVPTTLPTLFWPDTLEQPTSAQPAASVMRGVGAARFVWLGGDPAVDFPKVTVERETFPDLYEPLTGTNSPVASSHDGAVVLTYTPDPVDASAPSQHFYTATWQPVPVEPFSVDAKTQPLALPVGRYRLSVAGRAQSASGVVSYQVSSSVFEVLAATPDVATATRSASTIDVVARFSRAPGLRALTDGVSDADIVLPAPWTVTLEFDDDSTETQQVVPAADGSAALTPATLGVARVRSVDVRDVAGNGAAIAVE